MSPCSSQTKECCNKTKGIGLPSGPSVDVSDANTEAMAGCCSKGNTRQSGELVSSATCPTLAASGTCCSSDCSASTEKNIESSTGDTVHSDAGGRCDETKACPPTPSRTEPVCDAKRSTRCNGASPAAEASSCGKARSSQTNETGCCIKEPPNSAKNTANQVSQDAEKSDCSDLPQANAQKSCVGKTCFEQPTAVSSCRKKSSNLSNCCSEEKKPGCAPTTMTCSLQSCSDDACCDEENVLSQPMHAVGDCRGKSSSRSDGSAPGRNNTVACCADEDCCDTTVDGINEKQISPAKNPIFTSRDLEKGVGEVEHVTLGVEGLTCVGCETKLRRSLAVIPMVRNLQTSLVMSQAEFDLDMRYGTVDELILKIERATGFACRRINTQGQNIDVLVPGNPAEFIQQAFPIGVLDLVVWDKCTVRITYNPRLVGARNLVEESFGTSLELAPLLPAQDLLSGKRLLLKTGILTTISVIFSIPVLVLTWAPLFTKDYIRDSICLGLTTVVQVVVAGPFYPSAIRGLLFTHMIELDLLVVLSTSTAYLFSVVSFMLERVAHPLQQDAFFDTSCLLITLIMAGRFVSTYARHQAVKSISIRSLQPRTTLLHDGSMQEDLEIDARLLQYGDVFKVLPESRIVTDGLVMSGVTEVDESMITGEARMVEKSTGSVVVAGSINMSGVILVKATHLPGDNTISEIAAMVDEAKFSKPKVQDIADRFAGYFVPFVITLSLITLMVWILVGKYVQHTNQSFVPAITYAIAVMIISCPCAIGLAVPMVVVIAGGVAAKCGVIFKSAETISTARKVTHVVFDKTGTLTQGQLSVVAQQCVSDEFHLPDISTITLGLTANSRHPVSVALASHLKDIGIQAATVQNAASVVGCGMEGVFANQPVRAGNSRWLAAESNSVVQEFLTRGLTVFCVEVSGELAAVYGLADTLRPDAIRTITELQRRGLAVSIVSGDDHGPVEAVAREIGLHELHIRSRCNPSDKRDYIRAIREDTHSSAGARARGLRRGSRPVILFCGDGTNDAVALAEADVGLHMTGGTDIAQSAADAVLIRPNLAGVLVLLDVSRAASRRIHFNFLWAFLYNVVAILMAAGAFVVMRIPPQYAGLGELVSVVPVILIALQLRWVKFGQF